MEAALIASSLLLPPVTGIVVLVVVVATLGKSLGVREAFVATLQRVFEWASIELSQVNNEDEDQSTDGPSSKGGHKRTSSDMNLIERHATDSMTEKLRRDRLPSHVSTVKTFVDDTIDFTTAGIEAIIQDEVTSRFKAEQLASWNLLARTSYYQHINWKLAVLWFCGFIVRYCILLPLRTIIFCIGISCLVIFTTLIGYVPSQEIRKRLNYRATLISMRILLRSISGIIRFHNRENQATSGGICVANHTSPLDVMVLSCDNCYAMVGQKQPGLLGFLQRTLSRSEHHIWFERTAAKDRHQVTTRMKEHVDDPTKLPIIIFPEGTCINNTSIMMFKKGSFEVATTIYPIALKYDPRFGDPFWNSSEQSYAEYVLRMMTSWAIICDVWYLPPMTRNADEDSIAFARRVKHAIAEKGGLLELEWDGGLKRAAVPEKLKTEQKQLYWDRLKRTSPAVRPKEDGFTEQPTLDELMAQVRASDELMARFQASMADHNRISPTKKDELPECFDDEEDSEGKSKKQPPKATRKRVFDDTTND